ncbi:A/G-specific adenine glycosylase [Actinotalea sp. K2]|uniref:A/G-specific adenine glycosylase n=1 Tax=Actinotalea sp. K2 TaxID=2939438 RepID=UPI002017D35D|nr:A/G-specific adenine glycosylase [Actinotalea sp. K2]MCL3863093.1 A/G-specific adenine glycosylase [Actinotalea sp. K2]
MSLIVDPVVAWFAQNARPLPWRDPHCSPWGVLVSEVMLQQTPVVRVEPRWREWMALWPTPADLAAAGTAEVLRAWDRLGYPRRALRLHQCARVVVDRHDGELPTAEADLLALPGVGTYTAAAVTAFAHGRRAVVVDTNVRRVLARALTGTALPAPSLTAAEMRAAGSVVPAGDLASTRWNAAVMELGALVCTARSPRCGVCPIADACAWRLAGMPADAHAHRRRRQTWAGTDRQVRGRVMALLRSADHPLPVHLLEEVSADAEQRERALAGLVRDGLVVRHEDPATDDAVSYRLPD